VLAAVKQAVREGTARLDHGVTIHQFLIEPGGADVELRDGSVVWRLDAAKAAEMIVLLDSMIEPGPPAGHHYLDGMSTPAQTVVLSRNEYSANLLPSEAVYP
jgi:hypothetical protein